MDSIVIKGFNGCGNVFRCTARCEDVGYIDNTLKEVKNTCCRMVVISGGIDADERVAAPQ